MIDSIVRVRRAAGAAACLFAAALLMPQIVLAQQCQNPTPVWADEFDGNSLNTNNWEPMIGDGCSYGICGWGNNELQSYQAANASVTGGLLTITAKKQRVKSKGYTSARLRTANMPNSGEWKNGRFEARIKTPDGTGMWPAFWMLPTDPNVGWPTSGEIDILESTGQADMIAMGTIHVGDPWQFVGNRLLKQPDAWSDGFHVYAIEWEPNEIRWYVDDLLYSVKTPADLADPSTWQFENYQYHLLLNLAVGGNIGGAVDDSMLPQTMQVDYVRVYDFGQPSLSGDHLVEPNSSAIYSVIDEVGTASSYSWSVPAGTTITSGANSSTVSVDWGTQGGDIAVAVSNSCGARNLALDVYVAPELVQQYVFDDFESNRNFAYTTNTGTFEQSVANPGADATNPSDVVARYTRNSAELYDVIAGNTAAIPNAADYVTGNKAFYLDVYTAAPIGTAILVQLENSSTAIPTNYPTGRHSKYIAHTSTQNAWQRLKFELDDRIDGGTSDTQVDSIVVLIDPNALTGDVYYLDNFDSYGVGGGGTNPTSMAVSNVSTGTAGAGKGKKYARATITVLDNTGAGVANATVTGDFSGTINETGVSGTTDANGVVELLSTTTASGGVSVNFCVSALAHASLTHDSASSVSLCP